MICLDTVFEGNVSIGDGTIIHPYVTIKAINNDNDNDNDKQSSSSSSSVLIGEKNIIEEYVSIYNSNIGHGNIIQVSSVISNSIIGDFNQIGPRVTIKGKSSIGNGCIISPGLILDNVTIPDNIAVYGYGNDKWRCAPADNSITYALGEAIRATLLDPNSPQCLHKHFKERVQE